MPKGSGTAASATALLFWWALGLSPLVMLLWLTILLLISGPLVCFYEANLRLKGESDVHDRSEIVIDEWIGMGVSLLAVPLTMPWPLVAFVFFRFFDIKKPLGVRYFDERHLAGYGVSLDDVLAGVYALGVTYAAFVLLA